VQINNNEFTGSFNARQVVYLYIETPSVIMSLNMGVGVGVIVVWLEIEIWLIGKGDTKTGGCRK
jgi:hypothetical protein